MAKPVQKNCTHLTASHLIKEITDCLGEIPDHRPNHCKNGIPFGNFAKSAFAMMQMKMPSMLRFDNEREDPVRAHNLETMFDVTNGSRGLRIKYEQSYSIVVRVFHYSTRLLIA